MTDIADIAQACVTAGADGLSMINTTLGMVINTDTMRPALAGITAAKPACTLFAICKHALVTSGGWVLNIGNATNGHNLGIYLDAGDAYYAGKAGATWSLSLANNPVSTWRSRAGIPTRS